MKKIIPLLILAFVAACNDETTASGGGGGQASVGIAVPGNIAAVPSN
jgi:hypothetical protein|tara:strand:+ start:222 stop:362 length:141 start_codon:yes stop_codon:yes gene_type:complete